MQNNEFKTMSPRQWSWYFFCWFLALIATAGSLFLSEVMDFVPCVLCWYQRIPMYALVVVVGVGLYTRDVGVYKYAQALAVVGLGLAAYHCLLYLGFIPKGMIPCGPGPSCADQKLELWGFVTIPLMSVFAFAALVIGLKVAKRVK
jgi:disulfide bond formation protein DsbB